jgi:fatty-acyl-CoA synthase
MTATLPASRPDRPSLTPRSTGTYVDSLLAVLASGGRRPVLTWRDRDVTALELSRSIARYARALAAVGIGRGSLVALDAPNVPDALAVRYAAHTLGAATMYLPDGASSSRRVELLATIDPQLVVVFAATVHRTPRTTTPIATIGCERAGALARLDDLAAVQRSVPVTSAARPGDLAVVISSGGTTGTPRGSARTFGTYDAMVAGPWRPERRQLANGELAHLTQVLVDQTLLGGGTVVLDDTCDPAATLATIERQEITDVFLVEPQLLDLVDHQDVARRDLSSLTTVLHIGASAPTALRLRARSRLGPVLVHTYGSSEVGIVSSLGSDDYDPASPNRFRSAGRIVAGVEVRFRRADGSLDARCRTGTIEVRSPAAATGYRNRPVEAAAVFGVDGWCRTGDLGYLDREGYLHVLGRADDVATIEGVLVTPTTAEDTLMRSAAVRVASVVADREAGRWVAAVVAWPGARIDVDACRARLTAALGPQAAGQIAVLPLSRIPLTGQGKPDRRAIAALARGAARAAHPSAPRRP